MQSLVAYMSTYMVLQGVQEIIADVLAATRATCSDLDVKARKQEEKLVQADAESKRLHGKRRATKYSV